MADNKVLCVDAIDHMSELADDSFDLLLTDIPYARVNKDSQGLRVLDKGRANVLNFDLEEFASHAFRVTKGNGLVFCGKEQFSELYAYFDKCNVTTRMIVWEKTNPSPMNGQHVFLSGVECAVHFRKPKATFNGRCLNTVFRYPHGRSKQHPTEKPLALISELVSLLSNPDDLVFDPCVGSGTTAVACQQLGRRFHVSDISPDYVSLTKARLGYDDADLTRGRAK